MFCAELQVFDPLGFKLVSRVALLLCKQLTQSVPDPRAKIAVGVTCLAAAYKGISAAKKSCEAAIKGGNALCGN